MCTARDSHTKTLGVNRTRDESCGGQRGLIVRSPHKEKNNLQLFVKVSPTANEEDKRSGKERTGRKLRKKQKTKEDWGA